MIIVQVAGGVGNQLQQYALYRKFVSIGKEAKLDISWFEEKNQEKLSAGRKLELAYLKGVVYEACSPAEKRALVGGKGIPGKLRRKLFPSTIRLFQERGIFHPELLSFHNMYISGYFACEKYYADILGDLRSQIRFPEGGNPLNQIYAGEMAKCGSVSIHVRRGDYLDAADVYGGICTDAYYNQAIRYMIKKYEKPSFFVFTNDTFWAEKWCEVRERETGKRFTVIKGTDEETGYIDLMLMSRCKAHIIANSSFSWWGAWLNGSPGKKVIAPALWLRGQDYIDIFTEGMIRVNGEGRLAG